MYHHQNLHIFLTKKRRRKKPKHAAQVAQITTTTPTSHVAAKSVAPPVPPNVPPNNKTVPQTTPPQAHTPPVVPHHSNCSWKEHGDIKYRAYLSPMEATGFLIQHQIAHVEIHRALPTLCNEACSALALQFTNKQERMNYPRIKKCKLRQQPTGKHLVVHQKQINAGGESKQYFYAVLDRVPLIAKSGCMACALIAQSLGGIFFREDDGDMGWYFDNQDAAMDHIALCVVATAGTQQYYLGMANKVRKDAGGLGTNRVCRVGYGSRKHVAGSGKNVSATECMYYVEVGPGDDPWMIMTFPLRGTQEELPLSERLNSLRLL
jgi:hypothetical protein